MTRNKSIKPLAVYMDVGEEIHTDCLPPPALWSKSERERCRPRCSIAPGLTVMNGALNVGKHFISASSVFIRQDQPLAGLALPGLLKAKLGGESFAFLGTGNLSFGCQGLESWSCCNQEFRRFCDLRWSLSGIWGYVHLSATTLQPLTDEVTILIILLQWHLVNGWDLLDSKRTASS